MTPRVRIVTLILLTACGCGGSATLSRQDVQRAVERQAKASVTNPHGQTIEPSAKCAEDGSHAYTCALSMKIGKGKTFVTLPPKTVRAILSKDGKNVVVQGL